MPWPFEMRVSPRGHVLPRRALIVGAIEPRAALERAADDVDAFAVGVHRDRDADATVVLRQRVDLLPRLAGVGRLVERRAVRPLRRTASAPAASQTHRLLPCDVAKITFGLSNAYSTSRVPFAFSGRSVFSHVLPPSVVR